MADIAKAIVAADGTVTNLIDPITRQSVNYKPVTVWYDGSPMTNEKCDGRLYRRKGSTYYKQVIDKDGELFLEKDTMAQMRALTTTEILLLKAGYYKGVTLNGYYEKGDTPAPIQYYLSTTTRVDDGGMVIEIGGIKLEHNFSTGVNVKYYGAKGDKYFDNSDVFQKILDTHEDIIISDGSYIVTKELLLRKLGKTSISGVGTIFIDPLETLTTWHSLLKWDSNINMLYINGITFDGSLYGDYNEHIDDDVGMFVINTTQPNRTIEQINISNCIFKNIYGSGLNLTGKVFIENNIFINVGGYKPTLNSDNANDYYGDAIYINNFNNGSNNISGGIIKNNYIQTDSICRAGIVLEFGVIGVKIDTNFISGYEKQIHIEDNQYGLNIVSNNNLEGTIGILIAHSQVDVIGNNITSKGFDTSSLYYQLRSCILVIDNASYSTIDSNILISNDDSLGRTLNIQGGYNTNLKIINNNIHGCIEFPTTVYNLILERNLIDGTNSNRRENTLSINTSSFTKILNNTFINVGMSFIGLIDRITIQDNVFQNTLNYNQYITLASSFDKNRVKVLYNIFNALNKNQDYVIFSYGLENSLEGEISGNEVISNSNISSMLSYPTISGHNKYNHYQDNLLYNSTTKTTVIDSWIN